MSQTFINAVMNSCQSLTYRSSDVSIGKLLKYGVGTGGAAGLDDDDDSLVQCLNMVNML